MGGREGKRRKEEREMKATEEGTERANKNEAGRSNRRKRKKYWQRE